MKEQFADVLIGKKIPILTLDNKWYKLLDEETRAQLAETEEELNALIRKQGKINTEVKEIKNLKKKLMNDIVVLSDEKEQNNKDNDKKIEQNKKLLKECNDRLDEYRDELMELPAAIEKLNSKLMVATMEHCYSVMHENSDEIEEISEWVKNIRIELKKKLIKKQEMEQKNQLIYSYMHDIFGAEIVDLFDLQYNHSEQQSKS